MGFPTGDIKLSSNFEVNIAKPLDARFIVNDITSRNNISFKYEGMIVWVKSTSKHYKLSNNLTTWLDLVDTNITVAELGDAIITSPINGQVLTYHTASTSWINLSLPYATTSSLAGYIPRTGTLIGLPVTGDIEFNNNKSIFGTGLADFNSVGSFKPIANGYFPGVYNNVMKSVDNGNSSIYTETTQNSNFIYNVASYTGVDFAYSYINYQGFGNFISSGGNITYTELSVSNGLIVNTNSLSSANIKTDLLNTIDKVFQFPNNSGTIALISDITESANYGSNGLTKTGNTFLLGGNLNQNTTITTGSNLFTISGSNGLRYAADISSFYTNRSLVDKEYVVNHTGAYLPLSGGTMNGNINILPNYGLHSTSSIFFGRSILTDIKFNYIDDLFGPSSMAIKAKSNLFSSWFRLRDNGVLLVAEDTTTLSNSNLQIYTDSVGLYNSINGTSSQVFITPNGVAIKSAISVYNGEARLFTNNLTSYRDYTFPDQSGTIALTSDIISANTTAGNGLTMQGHKVKLGGVLTEDTIINGTNFDITFNVNHFTVNASTNSIILKTNNVENLTIDSNGIGLSTNDYKTYLKTNNLTQDSIIELPNQSGSLALISDISAGINATNGLNKLGNIIKLGGLVEENTDILVNNNNIFTISSTSGQDISLDNGYGTIQVTDGYVYINSQAWNRFTTGFIQTSFTEATIGFGNDDSETIIAAESRGMVLSTFNGTAIINSELLSNIQTYLLPDESGVIALTSDIQTALDENIQTVTVSQLQHLINVGGIKITKKYLISNPQDGGQVVVDGNSTSGINPVSTWYYTSNHKAFGLFRLSAGSTGAVTVLTVNGTSIISSSISYATSLTQTITNVVANINGYASTSGYRAYAVNDVCVIEYQTATTSINGAAVAVTTTGTLATSNITSMRRGINPTLYRFSIIYNAVNDRILQCQDDNANFMKCSLPNLTSINPISRFRWNDPSYKRNTFDDINFLPCFVEDTSFGFSANYFDKDSQCQYNIALGTCYIYGNKIGAGGTFINNYLLVSGANMSYNVCINQTFISGSPKYGINNNSILSGQGIFSNTILSHACYIANNYLATGTARITFNTLVGDSSTIYNNQLLSSAAAIINNSLNGALTNINNNTINNTNSYIRFNTLNGYANAISSNNITGASSEITFNTLSGANATINSNIITTGTGIFIRNNNISGASSTINSNTITGSNSEISANQLASVSTTINTNNISTAGSFIRNNNLTGASTNINTNTMNQAATIIENNVLAAQSAAISSWTPVATAKTYSNINWASTNKISLVLNSATLNGTTNLGLTATPINLGYIPATKAYPTSVVFEGSGTLASSAGSSLSVNIATDTSVVLTPSLTIANANTINTIASFSGNKTTAVHRTIQAIPAGTITVGSFQIYVDFNISKY